MFPLQTNFHNRPLRRWLRRREETAAADELLLTDDPKRQVHGDHQGTAWNAGDFRGVVLKPRGDNRDSSETTWRSPSLLDFVVCFPRNILNMLKWVLRSCCGATRKIEVPYGNWEKYNWNVIACCFGRLCDCGRHKTIMFIIVLTHDIFVNTTFGCFLQHRKSKQQDLSLNSETRGSQWKQWCGLCFFESQFLRMRFAFPNGGRMFLSPGNVTDGSKWLPL